jgi:hypothetical protein
MLASRNINHYWCHDVSEPPSFPLHQACARPWSLLLDITSSRVRAAGGIFDKARALRRCPELAALTIILFSGDGIEILLPGELPRGGRDGGPGRDSDDEEPSRGGGVGEAIKWVDARQGSGPVAILGYWQVRTRIGRGSVRATERKPRIAKELQALPRLVLTCRIQLDQSSYGIHAFCR